MTDIEALSPAKRALLERALRQRRAAAGSTIPRRTGTEPAPLSYAQQRMWFLQQWEPDAPTFKDSWYSEDPGFSPSSIIASIKRASFPSRRACRIYA